MQIRAIKAFIPIFVVGHVAIAAADDTAADAFKRGQSELKAGRVAEACKAFEESQKLEAKVDTQLSLASCYEKLGKLVTAANLYRELADKDSNVARRKTSAANATKLDARAPKLRITLSQKPAGLVIKLDGVEVSDGLVSVDIGPHEVIATAPGFEGKASVAVDKEKATLDVIVRMEAKPEPLPEPEPKPEPKPEPTPQPTATTEPSPPPLGRGPEPVDSSGGSHRKRNGAIIGAVGLGSLIGAAVFYKLSADKFKERDELCPGDPPFCPDLDDFQKGLELRKDARNLRGVAIGMGIGGVVLTGLGAYLFFTAPTKAPRVSFQLDHDGGALTYFGRF